MATNDQQNDLPVSIGKNTPRTSVEFLPKYFRTLPNKKFLAATVDQMIQTGVAEKLNAYYGRRNAKAVSIDDNYITDTSSIRQNYQLEPSTVIQDELGNVTFYKDYIDYINQLANFSANTENHSRNNAQEYYAWNPHINWDKFVNFREYYWMPFGPQIIDIRGQANTIVSTYTVTLPDTEERAYVFSPDGFTRNPALKLYRGQTYIFEISAPGHPFSFKTKRSTNDSDTYTTNITSDTLTVESGTLTFTVPPDAPDTLFYVSKNDIDRSGLIQILDIDENTSIDVDAEIIGKKTYKSSNGVELMNGMRIRFGGNVTPETYDGTQWYVEGVGDRINLVNETDLEVFSSSNTDILVPFDQTPFDRVPFSQADGYSAVTEYIVSNRASPDKNQWARSNKWIHRNVIEETARVNGLVPEYDENYRAKRPIIEFNAGLKLANFGTRAKGSVDLVDTFTTDVFSTIEGSSGYSIDGITLVNGMRILVTADTDILANNKIYEVKFITFFNNRQITLIPTDDSEPLENDVVYVSNGSDYKGKMFHFNGTSWIKSQDKTETNQPIVFDLFDTNGVSIFDYPSVINPGTKLFSYNIGTGAVDSELGFSLDYRVVENSGDILFTFNLLSDVFEYQVDNQLKTVSAELLRLRKYVDNTTYTTQSAWTKAPTHSYQSVIRLYNTVTRQNNFSIDVYDDILNVADLWHKVYVNSKLQKLDKDYTLVRTTNELQVQFVADLDSSSTVEIKTRSTAKKNANGYYEVPTNLERNPLNESPKQFTFGEVSDHVSSIVEELKGFEGTLPGPSNLDNLGNITPFGRKFVQHSGLINLSSYHLLSKEHNIINAISQAQLDYGKFKREFIQVATGLGFDGTIHDYVDAVLLLINRSKTNDMPYFFSDMMGVSNFTHLEYEIVDANNQFYALPEVFNLTSLSNNAVYVYLNDVQLLHNRDYIFTDAGFVQLSIETQVGDALDIHFYESTDGCYIPPTPSKLGLYPLYEPIVYIDTTYQTPTKVIQGHDGSITVAYNDFRDDLLLEFERRIYNNVKVAYDKSIIDINDFIPGANRTTSFTKNEIDQVLISDFIKWLELVGNVDYTDGTSFYDTNNSFTYNYITCKSLEGEDIQGFWRSVYRHAFDTDRPHSHPWEMLGFAIKPSWWEELYGPAPYTSDNLLMWQDIADGKVYRPGKNSIIDKKYVRPNLLNYLPVDAQGNLLSPLQSGYARNFTQTTTRTAFQFGDESPTETAWRRSSDYPFALIKSWTISQPSHMFAVGFDRARTIRDEAGDLVYSATNQRIKLSDILFPNTILDNVRIQASGLVNYMAAYLSGKSTTPYDTYRNNVVSIKNKLSIRLGGFTDKSKFNMILDSRTPLNQGNILLPQENFEVFLNTSSPTRTLIYSGVLIEKRANGFVVRGYNKEFPIFTYLPPVNQTKSSTIKVGGVSENFVTWTAGKSYAVGQIVENENSFYRVTEAHAAGSAIDTSKFAKLPELPIVGGVTVSNRKVFEDTPVQIQYGTVLTEIQDVVDFLLGYGAYLNKQGFLFNYFNTEYNTIENWLFSVKEFLFWTTQNWGAGSILTLSPGATSISYTTENEVVDDLFDGFYDYSVVKSDGQSIPVDNIAINRTSDNSFEISVKNTNEGIYGVKIPLVQKEHIVIIDNTTVFNDIIYAPTAGYRQERIKILGYRTDGWNGSFNIPGFIYDNVNITLWSTWKDYSVGAVVKYKEFYYVALENIPGSDAFDSAVWQRLAEKPQSKLQGNLEYKTNQFADFYDLDTDNFDVEQQKLAQHLIGYQKRKYLQNIISDDVSQYKFYQGMIQEKGTANSLTKLFDKLGTADKDSLEFYEEWAIKLGHYGAVDNVQSVEFTIDEAGYRLEPQPVKLVDILPSTTTDLVLNLTPREVYLKPDHYVHAPFPTVTESKEYVRTAGYVHTSDIDITLEKYSDLLTLDSANLDVGTYIWIGDNNGDWDVLEYKRTELFATSFETTDTDAKIKFSKKVPVTSGEIIAIVNSTHNGFYTVSAVNSNEITLGTTELKDVDLTNAGLLVFTTCRYSVFDDLINVAQQEDIDGRKVWIDDNNGKWGTYKNSDNVISTGKITNQTLDNTNGYLSSFAANQRNTILVVGAPNADNGKIFVYTRPTSFNLYSPFDELTVDTNFTTGNPSLTDANPGFGSSVSITPDGKYIFVGSPLASNVKTNFQGQFDENTNYSTNSVVEYLGNKWEAILPVSAKIDSRPYVTFNSSADLDNQTPYILTGNYPFTNTQADHILVRVPKDIYDAVEVNQQIVLYYLNSREDTNLLQEPFNGSIPLITNNFINDAHLIANKIDAILLVETPFFYPSMGDTILTDNGASLTISHIATKNDSISLCVSNVVGALELTGELTVNGIVIGEYVISAPTEAFNNMGGFFKIETAEYTVRDITSDSTDRLVYKDVLISSETLADANLFYSIEENARLITQYDSYNDLVKYASILSYDGNVEGVAQSVLSNKWVIRLPADFKDVNNNLVTTATTVVDIPQFKLKTDPISATDLAPLGLSAIFERDQTVAEIWDGWIDIQVDTPPNENSLTFIYPRIGNTITDGNGNSAVVQFIQSKGVVQRCYVLNTGTLTWKKGSEFSDSSRVYITDPDRFYTEVEFGFLRNSSIAKINPDVGYLAVFTESATLPVPTTQSSVYVSYWMYNSDTLQGTGIDAEYPNAESKYWKFTNKIIATKLGTGQGYINEGLLSIYNNSSLTGISKNIDLITDFREEYIGAGNAGDYFKFGSEIKVAQTNDLYTIFVKAADRIVIFKHGTDATGNTYDWEIVKDSNFRGKWNATEDYLQGELVSYINGRLYRANTNHIDAGPAPTPIEGGDANWYELSDIEAKSINLGYIPITDISEFKVSKDGSTVIGLRNRPANIANEVVIYKLVNGTYVQPENSLIVIDTLNTEDYPERIALSDDGTLIAVGSYNAAPNYSGKVIIYTQTSFGNYTILQTLESPQPESGEKFGYSIDFSNNDIAIASRSGDLEIVEKFNDNTYFDNNSTTFKAVDVDYGKVYHFENLNGKFVFSSLINNENSYPQFGNDLYYNNGHLYLPFKDQNAGELLEFRKTTPTAWNLIREQQYPADINKIKTAFVYNKSTQTIIDYVDIIDPIQGRFAGIAEQELNYKTYYDPAVYDFGNDSVNINGVNPWGPTQIGKVWLDLTTIKFYNPYHSDVSYSSNIWNQLFVGSTVDVYEWVESDYLPSEWNDLADTTAGIAEGISGTTKYDDTVYCERKKYDSIAQSLSTKYYFWVKNKKTVPAVENRNLNVYSIAQLIADPAGQGYKFVALVANNKFVLFNMKGLVSADECALHVSYYTSDNYDQNMHAEYQLVTEGLGTSKPKDIIVEKWIDSLVGYDKNTREVPDPLLSPRERYGNLNRPRQGWFVNRIEALKQYVERVNYVLSSNLITDEYDLSELQSKDPLPLETTKLFDLSVETEVELQYIYTNKLERAVVEPVIVNGRITDVKILSAGKGYKVPPSLEISGTGIDADISLQIGESGQIINATIGNSGYGYSENTIITVRPFSVLVQVDGSINGKWSIYNWNATISKWDRVIIQDYDVSLYWNYKDWYAEGYNQFTEVNFLIDGSYELPKLDVNIGEIVKIKNVGSGGWLLLEKDNEIESDYDYSINYKTIGKQNGTIAISNSLYDFSESTASFDGFNYDVSLYDNIPIKETRIILENVRNNLFVDELETEFNKLFFSSIRYVLSEQPFVDWLFKTSFVKAKHNFGELAQKVTYQNDNLSSYEDYVQEVKPFKTKIREYLSAYDKTENTNTVVTDFDLAPKYNPATGKIEPPRTIVLNNVVQAENVSTYPDKSWADNVTFYVSEIKISNAGAKYTVPPKISLIGGGGSGATAVAYTNSGKVTRIVVTNPGTGYITPPTVIIDGSIQDGGTVAEASAILRNDTTRKFNVTVKFDRVSGMPMFTTLSRSETLAGASNKLEYTLKYPVNLDQESITVYIDDNEQLPGAFTFGNKLANLDYTSEVGYIKLVKQLTADATIRVVYTINQSYLTATDRINHFYNPTSGMFGNDLSQLMTGIDYGGVEVRSFDFDNVSGWDSEGWYNDVWDSYDVTFEDIIKPLDSFETTVQLSSPLENGIEYNVYVGPQGQYASRIDDPAWVPEYDLLATQTAELAVLESELYELSTQLAEVISNIDQLEDNLSNLSIQLSNLYTQLNATTPGTPEYIAIGAQIAAVNAQILSTQSSITSANVQKSILQSLVTNKTSEVANKQIELDATTITVNANPLTISGAGMTPIIGDGVTTTYSIPERFNNDSTAKTVIIRKTTSDGTFIPDESAYDTALSGGTFAYTSAKGITAGEIIVDGDGFVTPTTSSGPEEQVPGQVLDTVDIKVYDRIGQGAPMIVARNYTMKYFAEEAVRSVLVDLENDLTTLQTQLATISASIVTTQQSIANLTSQIGALYSSLNSVPPGSPQYFSILSQISNLENQISAANVILDSLNTDRNNKQQEIVVKQTAIDNQTDIVEQTFASVNVPLELGALPASKESVIVRVDNRILSINEYELDFTNKTVKIIDPAPAGSIVSTITMTTNGANILDIGNFVSDGSTTQFLTGVQWQDDLTAFVAVNGEKYSAINSGSADRVKLVRSDETYAVANNVIIEFAEAVAVNDVINYAIYASTTQSFSEITQDRFTGDGNTKIYSLSQTPFSLTPLAQNVVAIVGNKLLSPGYYEKFDVTTVRRYQLNLTQYPQYSLAYVNDKEPITVYLNNKLLSYGVDYTWYTEDSALELKSLIGTTGDLLEIYVNNAEYAIVDDTIEFDVAPTVGEEVLIYQFSNHDVLEIERTEQNIILRDWFVPGDQYFEDYAPRSRGRFKLITPAYDVSYVWASINGELLIPNVDYYLEDTKDAIQIIRTINNGDRVDFVHFTGAPVSTKFGFRQFKDMLNRTHYKRLNNSKETTLIKDLNYFDLRIEVLDGSVLAVPNKNKNVPGVVFVNGERIEYMVKEGNTLRQLRRGTLGTSVNEFLPVGAVLSGQGADQTVPYKDKTYVSNETAGLSQTITANGIDTTFILDKKLDNYKLQMLGSVEITVQQLVGSFIVPTVIASGYSFGTLAGNNVIVFDTPPLAGDIIITLTGQARYNLNFNPGQGGVNEFEVFVAGKRLRKSTLDIFNPTADDPAVLETLPAEYAIEQYNDVDGVTPKTDLVLLNAPVDGTIVTVIRKQGQLWNPAGTPLKDAVTLQGVFLREATIDLPK